MSCSNFTTILTHFDRALSQRLVNSASTEAKSNNNYIKPESRLFELCPPSSDAPGQPSQVNKNKLKNVVSDTKIIQRQVGEILAKAIELVPVYAEGGMEYAQPAEQKLHYLVTFIDSLTRLINGKQDLVVTKDQMKLQSDLPVKSQSGLSDEFSDFLDKTLPEIANAANSRRNKIEELNRDFVLNFKAVVQDFLGDNALAQLERLDSLIVENLARVHKSIQDSEQYVDFNLDLYAPELTQNTSGKFDGLNIYIGVDLQGRLISEDLYYSLRQSMRLKSIADNIKNAGFPVTEVLSEVGEDSQKVYRIAIPLGET